MAIYKKIANNALDRFVQPVTDVHTSNKHVSYKTLFTLNRIRWSRRLLLPLRSNG
jgi:hypothetical protein